MNDLRTAAEQALEALENAEDQLAKPYSTDARNAIAALRAALAEPEQEPVAWSHINGTSDTKWHPPQRPAEPVQEPDLSHCPQCGGPADNGHDRSIPPSPYFCTKCMAEPVPVAWMHVPYPGSGLRQMVSLIRNREPSLYAATVPLYTSPPQRKPLTEEERNFCPRCGKRCGKRTNDIHTCTPP